MRTRKKRAPGYCSNCKRGPFSFISRGLCSVCWRRADGREQSSKTGRRRPGAGATLARTPEDAAEIRRRVRIFERRAAAGLDLFPVRP